MAKSPFLPSSDSGKADTLKQFAAKIPKYSVLLDIGASEVASTQADSIFFDHTLETHQQMQANAQQWTAYKNIERDGGALTAVKPVAPTLPTPAPVDVAPGIFARFSALVGRIKTHVNYTHAIGQDLGIIGAEQVVDPDSWKPVLGIKLLGGVPVVQWTKGDAGALEIWVDRGDGKGSVFLAVTSHPPYTDTTPLPAAAASALWKYRAIYKLRDERVGQWSDVLSVAVIG